MLKIFRQNTFTAGLLLLLFALMFRLPVLINAKPYPFIYDAFLSNILFDALLKFDNYILISYVLSMILIMIQAVMLNYTVSKHDILYKDTFLPGLMYILINSLYAEQYELTSQVLSNTFLMLVFQRLCYLYESPKPLLLVLDSGMFLGVGIMFNYSLLIFLPFILISVVVFTSFNLRYIVVSLMGILLPVYLILVFFYVTDRVPEMLEIGTKSLSQLQLKPIIRSYKIFAPWFILFPIAVWSAFRLQQNFFRNKVKTRRIIQSISFFTLFGIASLFTDNNGLLFSIIYISIPMSVIIAYYFISSKRFWLKEILLYAIIVVALYFQYY